MDTRISIFYRQYLQQIQVGKLSFPPDSVLLDPVIQSQMFRNMFTRHLMFPSSEDDAAFLPPASYQKRVLKELTRRLEAAVRNPDDESISDDLMEKMARFSTTKDPPELDAAQTMSTLTYSLPYDTQESLAHCVLIRESPNLLAAAGTTGLRTWDACLHLATYLATTTEGRSLVSGKSVLELGAGTGLLSLICAGPLSAAHVLATDADPNVDETITRNLNLNHHHHLCKTSGRQISLESRVLEWGGSGGGSPPADLARALLPSKGGSGSGSGSVLYPYYDYDTILGADITYSPDSLQALASTIDTLAESCPRPADIVISATIRNEETFDLFLGLCLEHGLSVYDVDFGCPELKLQKGLFHPLHPPIRIVRIKKER